MTIDFSLFVLFQIVIDLVFVGIAVWCVPKLRGYRRMIQVMTAGGRKVPTDPDLILEWVEKWKNLPEGSPKHTAYKNRLKEVGYLNADGD